MKIKAFAFALLLMVLFCGCTADYTSSALEKARAFALDNTRELTKYQRNHIRYVYPALWERVIFDHKPMTLTEYDHIPRNGDFKPVKSRRLDYMDLSFAWENIPGLDYSVIVLGHGERSGNFWEPLKVIRKKRAPIDADYEKARVQAAGFVANNMLYLSREERNRVRFAEAEVALTAFDLAYAEKEKPFTPKKRTNGLEEYLASLKKEAAVRKGKGSGDVRTQYSLVWKGDKAGTLIVISGISPSASLKDWKILSGAVLTAEVFEKYLREELYFSPADKIRGKLVPGEDPTVRPYRKNRAGKMTKEKK